MSEQINSILNGMSKLDNGLYYSGGRIVRTKEEAATLFYNMPTTDCRDSLVDFNIKKMIRDKVYTRVEDFYNNRSTDDEFLLSLGFSINLYYVVGLYSTFGKFDITRIISFVKDDAAKKYAVLINEYLYTKMVDGLLDTKSEAENVKLYEEAINLIQNKSDIGLEQLYGAIKPRYKNCVPDLYMLAKEAPAYKKPDEYLAEMIQDYPQFRFGWVYECLERGKQFYYTKGNSIEVYELKEKLGSELYWHILGLKPLDGLQEDWKDGKVNVTRPALFSDFGIGIPKIETVVKDKYYDPLISRRRYGADGTEEPDMTFDEIRKETERSLGVESVVPVEENPMRYMVKMFEVMERQGKRSVGGNRDLEEKKELVGNERG